MDILEYNATYTQVRTNTNIPWHTLHKTAPAHTLAHLGCVVQLLGRNHGLSQVNREEDPGETDIWPENRERQKKRAKGGKANGEKERDRK